MGMFFPCEKHAKENKEHYDAWLEEKGVEDTWGQKLVYLATADVGPYPPDCPDCHGYGWGMNF